MLAKQKLSRRTRGFTLTEAAIVLGIVGLILGAIWAAAAAVYNNQRVQATTTQVLSIVNAVRALYGTSPVIQTVIPAATGACDLANAGAMPKDMLTLDPATGACTRVNNVWGGLVQISTAGANATSFTLALDTNTTIPNDACRALVLRIGGPGHDTGLTNITGTGGAYNPTSTSTASLADAQSVCGASGLSSLSFVFNLR